ncbi:amidase [Skermanella aerolata]|uniref:amidase n=1 Tax=Skermanella aerolata TaxID=393310 RepID=UPI003D219B17
MADGDRGKPMNGLHGNRLGAFCPHIALDVPGAAEGPLAGLTFAAKDLFDVAGHATGAGNPTWLATHPPATATAPAVKTLLDAGARLVGKTITDELAFSINGENAHYGTPLNAKAPQRIPGGSSSGSASAVAGGAVPLALGTDTGGSVRVPAAFCGIYGFRPTHGRISLDGVTPLAPSFDSVGWFTRDAGLLERVGRVLLDLPGDEEGRPRSLLLVEDAFAMTDPSARAALGPAIDAVTATLGSPRDVRLSGDGLGEGWLNAFRTLQMHEVWRTHGAWISGHRPHFGPGVAERFQAASRVTDKAAGEAANFRRRVTEQMDSLLAGGDLLLMPTAPGIAPLKNTPQGELDQFRAQVLSMTCIAGLARLPQVSLPAAEIEGCPVGLSLVARRGGDGMLLAAAKRVAEVL